MSFRKTIFALVSLFASTSLAQTPNAVALDGDYKVELTIGDKVFIDHMTLKGKDSPIEITKFQGDITGSMTVPGMFTSPLEGSGYCTKRGFVCRMDFAIEANENGQKYKVKYSLNMGQLNFRKAFRGEGVVFNGSAYLEDGKLLGHYTATKQ